MVFKMGVDLYFYDEGINFTGIVDSFISLIWTERYRSAGSFELYMPLTDDAAKMLMPRRYIYRPDVGEAMYINGIEENVDDDGKRFIRAVGYGIEGILRKRCIVDESEAAGIFKVVKNVLASSPIADMEFGDDSLDTVKQNVSRGNYLEDWVRNSCSLNEKDISYKITLIPERKKMLMELYEGRDISQDMVFGDEWGNVTNAQYSYSEDGCTNLVICRCGKVTEPNVEGDKKGTPFYILGDSVGLARNERLIVTDPVVKDGVRVVYDKDGVPSFEYYRYLSYDDTLAKMKEEAAEVYSDATENYQADTLDLRYRSKWRVGDTVTVRNNIRNMSYIKRIEEVQETFDENGLSITPTFGEPLKTILDLVKR